MERYIFKVEDGERATEDAPSKGPVYRSIYAKDGFPPLPAGLATCWDLFEYVSAFLTLTSFLTIILAISMSFLIVRRVSLPRLSLLTLFFKISVTFSRTILTRPFLTVIDVDIRQCLKPAIISSSYVFSESTSTIFPRLGILSSELFSVFNIICVIVRFISLGLGL